MPIPGYEWDSYQTIHDLELLNGVPNISWDGGGKSIFLAHAHVSYLNFFLPVHPHLQFISHLPSNVTGEQLIAQLFRSIPDQQWLFQYGRVPLSFILSDYVWKVRLRHSNEAKHYPYLPSISEYLPVLKITSCDVNLALLLKLWLTSKKLFLFVCSNPLKTTSTLSPPPGPILPRENIIIDVLETRSKRLMSYPSNIKYVPTSHLCALLMYCKGD